MPCSEPLYDAISVIILGAAIGSIAWFFYKITSKKKKVAELEDLK